jgi:hypothetical protein
MAAYVPASVELPKPEEAGGEKKMSKSALKKLAKNKGKVKKEKQNWGDGSAKKKEKKAAPAPPKVGGICQASTRVMLPVPWADPVRKSSSWSFHHPMLPDRYIWDMLSQQRSKIL